jgi:hypothetical protein
VRNLIPREDESKKPPLITKTAFFSLTEIRRNIDSRKYRVRIVLELAPVSSLRA